MRLIPLLLAIWFIAVPAYVKAQEEHPKKLIEYGWDVPYPDFIEKNIRRMEEKPFDGIVFRLRGLNYAFELLRWDESELKPQMDTLAAIKWNKFTHNFLCLQSTNKWGMNWFDDVGWHTITANLRLAGKAARIGHCVGICLDPEPYGSNPWVYSQQWSDKSFSEVEAQVRKRGAEFILALQQELPELRLLTFFQLSQLKSIARESDPAKRRKRLSEDDYALLPAFLNGMLDAVGPGVRIIDGNESAYYYTDFESFDEAYQFMHEGALVFITPENRDKYRSCVQAGMAIYTDNALNLRQPEGNYVSYFLSPQDRLLWFKHNVYYAIKTADEYVWCYSERMDWWREDIPSGAEESIRFARQKINRRQPLGFTIDNIASVKRYYGFQALKNGEAEILESCPKFIEFITAIDKIKKEARSVTKQINALLEKRAQEACVRGAARTPEQREKEWEAEKGKELQVPEFHRKPWLPEEERLKPLKSKDPEMYKLALQKYKLEEELKEVRQRLKDCIEGGDCKCGAVN
ncbi:MAG: hypothetical protein NT060_04990 [Candidatus Omnitrophica bacterium]|nr:hypothetical protein [Candidatus Omnitrophota bacterium]